METRRISGFKTERLLSPHEALRRFFERASLRPPQIQRVPLADARGRVLAGDIAADADVPNAPRSAMDGFAVRSSDVPGVLRITDAVRMGQTLERTLGASQTVRIPTGGTLPPGADAVVPIEDARIDGDTVYVERAIPPGDCVTPAASDMRAGEVMLRRGRRLEASDIGILATLGHAEISVFRRPRIAIVSTGDELVDMASAPGPGQVRDSNRWVIAAHAERLGAEAWHVPTPRDEPAAIEAALCHGLEGADAVVLTGGSSVGERDLTPDIIARLGDPGVIVHGLRVKPGKPTVLAAVEEKPIIALPGNPTSALVIFDAVGSAIVTALSGSTSRRHAVCARLTAPLAKRAGWTWYVPVRLTDTADGLHAQPLMIRSSMVSLLARADGYVTLGDAVESLAEGTEVYVRVLEAEA